MTQQTPLEALLDRAARTPEATALIIGGEPWSCARLAADSAALAEAFRARGVRAGDRVALHMYNLPELALAYLACWRIGAVAVPLNTRYKAPELIAMIARVRPALYLGEGELYAGVRDVSPEMLARDARFVVGLGEADRGARPWGALAAGQPAQSPPSAPEPPSIAPDMPAVLLATSGTTGPSKLVVWTQRTMATFVDSAASRGVGSSDIYAIGVPMMHAGGVWAFTTCLLTSATGVVLRRFDPDALLDAIAEHRCTTLTGLPFMHAELACRQEAHPRDVASISMSLCAGDVCSSGTEKYFSTQFPCRLLSFWGATEESAAGIPAVEPGPLTRFLAEAEIRLSDACGEDFAEGEAGELLVRSPSTAPGYWLGPGWIDPLPDGWFHSGDLMRREPDGQLRYMGRTKDLIVRAGSNISPMEVEEALRRRPGVADAAVAGMPDPELGQRVGAALVLASSTTGASVPEILAGVRAELADYKVPEVVAIVDAIPRNSDTKVDRKSVAEALVAERSRA